MTRYAAGTDEIKPQGFGAGGSKTPERKYPLAPKSEWYGNANFEKTGGKIQQMTPDEFLSQVRPLEMDDVARDNIDDLKRHMQSGKTLDPLSIDAKGKEDGRHRAIAAKELGIQSVPVLRWNADDSPPISPMGFGASTPKTPQQAARFETPGSPEYEAAVAKGLDMSQAGRMGRAKEMGFDTETAVYRGLTRPYDADTLAPGRFQFLAHDPNVASEYARNFADREGANVVKAFLRKPNPLVIDAGGANWDRIDTRNLPEELRAILDPRAAISAIATAAKSRGYGHVTVRNVVDRADGGVGSPTTVEVIWDPSNIRSVNAAFDPEKSTSSTLLAAAPFAAVSGAGLTSERELGSKMKRDKKD